MDMEEGSEKDDVEDEHEVDLDTGDEIVVKPESSVLSPVKQRRLSTDSASSNIELANKAEDAEVVVTGAISRTLLLMTPNFIFTSENCDNVLELCPNKSHIDKIMFGYFFFVTVDEKENIGAAIKDFCKAGYESVAYCHECIFSTDAALAKHKSKCKNKDDLNKLCKVIVSETPKFTDTEKVLCVYSPDLVLLSDIDQLKSISKHTSLLSFSFECFIECKTMLNSLNLQKVLHENDKHNFGPEFGSLKCYKVNSAFNYQTYSARSPQKAKSKVSKERETMRKTLTEYELQEGDQNKALLLLGQAVKSGNKGKSRRFLSWIQRLFGPDCVKVVSGTIDADYIGDKSNPAKRGPVSDFTVYNVAFFNSASAATAAYKRCNLVYMYGVHLNIVQMVSFMHTPTKTRKGASRAKSSLNSELLKSPSKVESSQLPVSAFLPGAKFEPGAAAFSGSEDDIPMSDSDLEPPKKKIFSPSKLARASSDVFDSLFPDGDSSVKSDAELVQPTLNSGPSPVITFLPKNGLISCLFCRKEKDSTCKELKAVCKENSDGLIQKLCGEQMNFNPEDFVICISCYETLPVIEVFVNILNKDKDGSRAMTAWDYMEAAKKVKIVMGDLIKIKIKDKEKEHIKQVKSLEASAKKKLEQKLWDKERDVEDLREQVETFKKDTKLEEAESRITELQQELKTHEDQLLDVNTEKGKLEKKLEEMDKVNKEKEDLSKQLKELTIKIDTMDKDSIKSVVREEMLKDELITKDSTIEELNKKVTNLEDLRNQDKNQRSEEEQSKDEQISVAQEELDDLKKEIGMLKADIEVKEKAVSDKETRSIEFQDKWRETEAKLAKRLNEVTKLGETIKEIQAKHVTELKESQAKHVTELKESQAKLAGEIESKESRAKHAAELKELQAKHTVEIKKHAAEKDALEHKLQNLSKTVHLKEERLQLLRDKRIDTFFHEVKVDVSKISEKDLNPRDLEILKSNKKQFESVSEELIDLKDKVSKLEKSLKAEIKEKEKWKDQLLENQLAGMEVPQLSQKVEDLKTAKGELEAKLARAEKKNRTSNESALENLQLQLEFHKAETERMQKEITDNKLKTTESNIEVLGDATKKIESLSNSLQSEEEKTTQLKANLKSEQEKYSKLKADLRAEQSKCKSLKTDFDHLKKLTDEVKQERDKYKSRLEDLRSYRDKYDAIKKKKSECESQIEDMKRDIDTGKTKDKKKSEEIKDLQNKISKMKDKNAELVKKNEAILKQSELGGKDLKKCHTSQEQQKIVVKNLEDMLKQVSSERSELLNQLQVKTETFESEKKSLEEVNKSIETQKQALVERQKSLVEARINFGKKLSTALDDIKVEQKKQKEIQEINETMKLEIASLQVKMGGEKKEEVDDELYDRLGKMYEDIEKERKERDEDREKIKKKDEELSLLKEEHRKVLAESAENIKNVEESSVKEEVAKQKQQNDNLSKQLMEVKKDLLKSKDAWAELSLLKTKLECEKEEITANSKELSAELESVVANEDKLKNSVEESKALVEASDKKMATMMHDLEHLREDKYLSETNNKKEIEKVKNEKIEKEKEMKKIKQESKSRDDTFEQLIKEKAEAVRKAEYLKLELEEVKEEAKSNEASTQLKSENEDLKRSNKQLESSNDGKNKIFSALKAEIEHLKNKNKQIETSDKEKDKKIVYEKNNEIQILKKDIDKIFMEKTALMKKLKDQEKISGENDVDKKFSLEKTALLKQIKDLEKAIKEGDVERALNETYKREMLELSSEIRNKCSQYDAEVSKTKCLNEKLSDISTKLEAERKEKIALQSKLSNQEKTAPQANNAADSGDNEQVEALNLKIEALERKNKKLNKTVAMLTKDDDDDFYQNDYVDIKPIVQTNEDRKSPKPGGLTLKSTASLLKAGVSSPFSNKPEAKASGTQSPALSRPPKLMSPNIHLNPSLTIGPVPISGRGRGRGGLSNSSTPSARSTPSPQAGRSNPSPSLARSNPSPSLTRFNPSPNQPRSNPSPVSIQPRPGQVQVQANRPSSNPSQPLRTPPPSYQRTMSSHAAPSNQAPPSPTPNHEEAELEAETDIENDLYEGLVEALEEAQNQRSNTEVQCKYEELLNNLLEKMPDNKEQIVRSLNRAFATVFPGTTVGAAARTSTGSASRIAAGQSPRVSMMEEIITPGAAAVTTNAQLNTQLASLGARGVQVQPFQQVQQQVMVPQQGMVMQQVPQQSRVVVPQQRMLVPQQNRAVVQQQPNRVMVPQQQQSRMLVPQQSRMLVPQQNMVPQQNLVQNQQNFVQQGMLVPQQNMVYSTQQQQQQGVLMQQQQQPQYIMAQSVPQQMQQVNLNQQLQQSGYQVFDSNGFNFDFQ
eukprot:GFUD01014902.1.p1 GENE.GFUD01014902.1~~GFUD01014902.1.p1  ORF type:complete len:2566 (+),score=919.79 GFUD01014902.1:685-7698(+)